MLTTVARLAPDFMSVCGLQHLQCRKLTCRFLAGLTLRRLGFCVVHWADFVSLGGTAAYGQMFSALVTMA